MRQLQSFTDPALDLDVSREAGQRMVRERGFFLSHDRRRQTFGQTLEVPLVTLSLAVLDSRSLSIDPELDPARLARLAAALKATAKQLTDRERRSAFVFGSSWRGAAAQ